MLPARPAATLADDGQVRTRSPLRMLRQLAFLENGVDVRLDPVRRRDAEPDRDLAKRRRHPFRREVFLDEAKYRLLPRRERVSRTPLPSPRPLTHVPLLSFSQSGRCTTSPSGVRPG